MKTIIKKYSLSLVLLFVTLFAQAQDQAANTPDDTKRQATPTAALKTLNNLAPGYKVNIIREITPLKPVKNNTELGNIRNRFAECRLKATYTDGYGRTVQTVVRKNAGSASDIVQYHEYDAFGRELFTPLPFTVPETEDNHAGRFKLNVASQLSSTYVSNLKYTSEYYFYTQADYDDSPLNRVKKTYAQGNAWAGSDKGVSNEVYPNTSENIMQWVVAYPQGSLPASAGAYAANTLWVKKFTDEDNNTGFAFYDMDGKMVCKQQTISTATRTYYVYDDLGRLRLVIPPLAVKEISLNSNTLSQTISDNLCFRNEYDELGRQVLTKKPGVGHTVLHYDHKDRVILSQDAIQRSKNEWVFVKYDIHGRMIQSGVYNTTALAWPAPGVTNHILNYLTEEEVYTQAGYKTTFPDTKFYITYYYDEYAFTTRTFNTNYTQIAEGYANGVSQNTFGKLTGTKTMLSDQITEVLSVNFYNKRGELIQVQNQLHNTGWSTLAMGYDFNGRLVKSIFQQSSNWVITKKYNYDAYDRLKNVSHKINNAANYRELAGYYYDELGRLKSKTLGNMRHPVFYEYNIRNWITGINRQFLDNKENGQYFGMEVHYTHGFNTTYLNGRVAGIRWRAKGSKNELRSYAYDYDEKGQLTMANYLYKDEAAIVPPQEANWQKGPKDFTASNMTYDENGNMLSMKHMGYDGVNPFVLDDLTYEYEAGTNKLKKVTEDAASQSKDNSIHNGLADFRDVNSGDDYTYDANGNLASDKNRGIVKIENYWFNINKPLETEYSSTQKVLYTYDAAGNLLRKKVIQDGSNQSLVTTFDYFGDIIYRNGQPFMIIHDEGRVRIENPSSAAPTLNYDYYIKDHISNVRCIITEEGMQSTDQPEDPMDPVFNPGTYAGAVSGDQPGVLPPVMYLATSEVLNNNLENQLFENISETRADRPLSEDPEDVNAAKLNPTTGQAVGPGLLLRVMGGDRIQLGVESFFYSLDNSVPAISMQTLVSSIVSSLAGLGGAMGTDGFYSSTQAATVTAGDINMALSNIQPPAGGDTTIPRAYLNYLMFDESMHLMEDASGAIQVAQANAWQNMDVPEFTVPQNGYIYVFTTNSSLANVRTDNMYVIHWKSRLLEEFNYYPFGLCFDVSRQVGAPKSDNKYNSQFIEQDEFADASGDRFGLDWYDFAARSYDPQIGRWMQPDPLMQHNSPYLAMSNNPIIFTDPMGLWDYVAVDVYGNEVARAYVPGTENGPDRISLAKLTERGTWELLGVITEARLAVMRGMRGPILRQEDREQPEINNMGWGIVGVSIATNNKARHVKAEQDYSERMNKLNSSVGSSSNNIIQAGISSDDYWLGPALITAGSRFKALKPVAALGSQPGSSITSTVLSKSMPLKMPFRFAGTTNLGRMIARTLPMVHVGVVLTALSIEDAVREISPTFDMIVGMRDFKMGRVK